jgi:ribokinase
MGNPRVLSVGNTVLDVIGKTPDDMPVFGELAAGRGPADMGVGGNGAIAAAAASALGAETTLASVVGDDVWGKWLRDSLVALGVGTGQLLTVESEPTATTVSLVRTDGERALLTHNGASDHHDLSQVDLSSVGEGDWVLVSSLFLVRAYSGEPLRRLASEAHERGAKVAMDMAWDCAGEWDLNALPVDEADIVLGNHDEVKAVACTSDLDTAVAKVMDRGVKTLVVKLGEDGARIITADGADVTVPAPQVVPVNATGTGDVFNAALLVALSGGRSVEDAVRFACAAGALRVSGGCHTFPTFEDVEALSVKGK